MKILFVVSHPHDWTIKIPGVEVVPARIYLTDASYCNASGVKVFNLCNSYRYQRRGYYVSLLAEARGHMPLPDVKALEDLHSDAILARLGEGISNTIQASLADVRSDRFALTMYFGRDAARQHEQLSEQLFNLLHVPLLQAEFERHAGRWHLAAVRAIPAAEIDAADKPAVARAAADCLRGHRTKLREPAAKRPTLAILHTPGQPAQPSNADALRKIAEAAEAGGMRAELITQDDAGRLDRFDALFIRDTTNVDHYTYQMARQAAVAGLVVIDDPDSILKCTNKVYLAELLARHGVPQPKTRMLHRDNAAEASAALGLPCVLKRPDSAFSMGVVKVASATELAATAQAMLEDSELIIAQEYLPTEFDWRIGVLDGQPLFACKYHMVPGHWQVIKHDSAQMHREGLTEAVAVEDVPAHVLDTALRAAALIGNGLYGVDLKQRGHACYVIEINDNPNIDAGNEDALLGDELYRRLIDVFTERIAAHKGSIGSATP